MELVTGAMGSLLPKLGELLKGEYDLQQRVREKVMSLSDELEVMHAALCKVAEVPREQLDDLVKIWARDVRELSYDMEDIIDAFLARVDDDDAAKARKLKGLMEKMGSLFSKGKARHQIAGAVEEINRKLQEVAKLHGRYTVHNIVANPAATSLAIDPRLLAMYKQRTQLVGVDGPRDTLIKMLSDPEEEEDASGGKKAMMNTASVSIVGIGGLGKSTLARAVYDHCKLQPGFDCWAFVPVGRNPDKKKILRDILIALDKQKYTNSNTTMLVERQLIEELREFLEKRRYFIVIDDIWDKESWTLIRCGLADNNCGSKIVATTRISEIATYVGNVYKLCPLSRENSEKLLHTRIVNCEQIYPQNQYPEVYDNVFHKCGGIPLAIITIASLLASKPMEDWHEVCNSIGFGHSANDDADNTRTILSYSYYDLPCHLRTCLLYLSMFPEDHFIRKHHLIWKWIAEGFIHDEQGIGPFQVGERYFNELINRSLIQPVEHVNGTGIFISGCHVHDMVLDLVRKFSAEENFVTILDKGQATIPHRKAHSRRLSIQNNKILELNPDADMGLKHVRSFAAFHCDRGIGVLPSFGGLRVLNMENCGFTDGSNGLVHIGNLHNLRYLGLRGTSIRELPNEIGKLKLLQTLDLLVSDIEELPSSVAMLTQLLCLHIGPTTRLPEWIGNLTSLQELRIYYQDKSPRSILGNLRDLRYLTCSLLLPNHLMDIRDGSFGRAFLECLGNLHKIQHVNISTLGAKRKGSPLEAAASVSPRHLRFLKLEGMVFSRVPEWINPSLLPNLAMVHVVVEAVQEQDMETLGRMPELRHLALFSHMYLRQDIKSVIIIGGDHDHSYKFSKLVVFETDFSLDYRIQCSSVVMPRLEEIQFEVHVRLLKEAGIGFGQLRQEALPSLQKAGVCIHCRNARRAEVEEAEQALRHAAAAHPNRPTLAMDRRHEDAMLS